MTNLEEQLGRIFHHETFKSSYQKKAIEKILESKNKNYIVCMATQGGKSLCYQFPGVIKNRGVTVGIYPSLAAINDHKNYLNSLDIGAETINSNIEFSQRDEIRNLITAESSNIRFLFLTPEMINLNRIMRDALEYWLKNNFVNYVIVDDAHKIVDSADYRTSFDKLKELRKINEEVPWIALTSFNPGKEIDKALNVENPLVLSSSTVRENIFYEAIKDGTREGYTMMDFFNLFKNKEGKNPSGIIYCETKGQISKVLEYFNNNQLAQEYVDEASVERWRNKDFPILVATGESFGYGINYYVPTIRFVIHLGMPENIRSFYHESGRVGNDGEMGYSRAYGKTNFFNNCHSEEFKDYFLAVCKKQFLAEKFGEKIEKCKNSCDECLMRT